MHIHKLSTDMAVSDQVSVADIKTIAAAGFQAIIINRPDKEAPDQPNHTDIIAAAEAAGLFAIYLPVFPGLILDADIDAFIAAWAKLPLPAIAFCASGARAATLWALSTADGTNHKSIVAATKAAGYDLNGLEDRLETHVHGFSQTSGPTNHHKILIVGGGAAGLAAAASLRKRDKSIDIAIIEPSEDHYYQPGFTLVGSNVFEPQQVRSETSKLIPQGVTWHHAGAARFEPDKNLVILEGGERISYDVLIVACGLKIDIDAIPGLKATLGKNGVTTNYLYQYAPYTAELADTLSSGTAIFTQPKGPFKCAGAPQKAMYLTCDRLRKRGILGKVDISFHMPGSSLFGIDEYVPALKDTVRKYGINTKFHETLISLDGFNQKAVFEVDPPDSPIQIVERTFDMLHVVPPQCAPDVISTSPLASGSGWVDVNDDNLQHVRYTNVFAIGDVISSPNAKTAAAVRKQAPVIAENVLAHLGARLINLS